MNQKTKQPEIKHTFKSIDGVTTIVTEPLKVGFKQPEKKDIDCDCHCHMGDFGCPPNCLPINSCIHCSPPHNEEMEEERDVLFSQAYECGKLGHDLLHLESLKYKEKKLINKEISLALSRERKRIREDLIKLEPAIRQGEDIYYTKELVLRLLEEE